MSPIAKGRAIEAGDIRVDVGSGLHKYERAILVVFDSLSEFRSAMKYGQINAPGVWSEPEQDTTSKES